VTLTLRPLAEDDLPIVSRWFEDEEARRWLGGPDWPAKALRLVESLGQLAFVAVDDGRPVGLLDCEVYDDRRASFAIAIDPTLRRKGVGIAAVEALIAHPSMTDVTELFAGVEEGNAASVRLLLRCGFVQVAEIDHEGFRYYARPAPTGPWRLPV
jgi:RimJ/RimL family protein N-acetyltransferase